MRETWVRSLGLEDPLEGMAAHSSILAWRISMDRGAWPVTAQGVTKNRTQLRAKAQHSTLPGIVLHQHYIRSIWSQSQNFKFILLIKEDLYIANY